MATDTWLIAGLGNPGTRYLRTRHNIGHMVLNELLTKMGAEYTRTKVGAKAVGAHLGDGGPKVIFAISEGYMNHSGKPIRGLLDFFSADSSRLVVIHDEVDLDFGRVKIKRGGSEGGHKGLKSITQHLGGHREYIRIRAGVGRPTGSMSTSDYVLQDFSHEQQEELELLIGKCAEAVELILTDGVSAAQNTIH